MIQSYMLCGIGLLAGCLLMLAFFPLIHERAVRLTKRRITEATPMTINEIQADKDHLRAEFAMSVRRLEIGVEEMRAKVATRYGAADRHNAAINRLQVEIDKKMALIFALRAREEVRKSVVRRAVKILLYFFARSRRWRGPASPHVFRVEQSQRWEFDERAKQSQTPEFDERAKQSQTLEFDERAKQSELAATAAAIAAINLKRRRAVASKF